jgi:predicted dehydrogenase
LDAPRVGFIGAGYIAAMHALAFKQAGFAVTAVCGAPGSERARKFAGVHEVPNVFHDASQLLAARDTWDALLITVSTDVTLDMLEAALDTGVPILVEKPVALRSADLTHLRWEHPNVLVAYNRRFYQPVQVLRKDAQKERPGIGYMILPDSITVPDRLEDDPTYLRNLFENSVHGLDLLRFTFGDLRIEHVSRIRNASGLLAGIAATLLNEHTGVVVQLTANWGAPANFAIGLHRPGRRIELLPFEAGTIYEGMEVAEPTPETPIRRYLPHVLERMEIPQDDVRYKPGFVAQARALRILVEGGDPWPAASLEDAYQALRLAEQLAGAVYGE